MVKCVYECRRERDGIVERGSKPSSWAGMDPPASWLSRALSHSAPGAATSGAKRPHSAQFLLGPTRFFTLPRITPYSLYTAQLGLVACYITQLIQSALIHQLRKMLGVGDLYRCKDVGRALSFWAVRVCSPLHSWHPAQDPSELSLIPSSARLARPLHILLTSLQPTLTYTVRIKSPKTL